MGEEPTTEELVDAVGEDSSLIPQEKETTIHFPKDRDRATVFSAEAGRAMNGAHWDRIFLYAEMGVARRVSGSAVLFPKKIAILRITDAASHTHAEICRILTYRLTGETAEGVGGCIASVFIDDTIWHNLGGWWAP